VLYTVRKLSRRNYFRYIGECYLHGLMDGEAMSWLNEGKTWLQSLRLV
jgi:hypothetical protein